MISRIKKQWVKIGCIGQIIVICSLSILAFGIYFYVEQQQFLQPISERLDVKDWAEFETYLKTTYVEGMTREEVYQELEAFGEYKITSVLWGGTGRDCEMIGLPTGKPVSFIDLVYIACFSPNDKLISWRLYD